MASRGATGSAVYKVAGLPTSWDESEKRGVRWKADIALPGWSSPVVLGNRVIVTGADEDERRVWCVDARDGRALWTLDVPLVKGAADDYMTDTEDPEWDARMYAASTPVVAGGRVYVMFSNGQLLALNLEDGAVVWNISLGDLGDNTYGLSGALRLWKTTVIIVFEGAERSIAAYDSNTGESVWSAERDSSTWASPCFAKTSEGKDLLVLLGDPDLTAWDPSTGKQVWTTDILPASPDFSVGPSPVFDGKAIYVNCQNSGIFSVDPDTGKRRWAVEELPDGFGFADGVSMVAAGGHVYQYYSYYLSCVDAETGKVIKEHETDDEASYASPFINGEHLYLFSTAGAQVLNANPAAGFAVIGTGVLDGQVQANPAISGDSIYIRTDSALYRIGN